MNNNKFMAVSLFLCSLAMIIGMILNINIYWFITDIIVIIICAVNGVLLLRNK
jgi:hypothetical protein